MLSVFLGLGLPYATLASQLNVLVEERIIDEFKGEIPVGGRFEIRLSQKPSGSPEYLAEFWRDDRTGKFIANVVTTSGDIERIWGVATLMIEVPVPTRRYLPEEIIQGADLQLVSLPYARIGAFTITDVESLDRMQVRRQLVPNRPIPRQSVTPPKIVKRGQIVKIMLTHGGLRLVAKGKSMSDGHLGQIVRVVNLSSNKTISAIAKEDGVVVVEQ